ncbi:hypothetical protein DFP73DRAFT_590667 [Morchella snyderi]|nr:hypothetical protein DFP73DRAFT_590667 [Morchella snyderi]
MSQLTYCQKKVIISVVVLTTISSVVFGLRIYARAFKLKIFGVDDWFMAAAYVWILFFEAASLVQVCFGAGLNDAKITPIMLNKLLKSPALTRNTKLNIFQCSPVPGSWTPLGTPVRCISMKLNTILVSSFHIITDVIIYILPLPAIIAMHTSIRRKLGLAAIFVIGAMPVAVSIVRLCLLAKLDWTVEVMLQSGKINTLSVIELNIALIAASMPALRIVFVNMGRKRITSEEAPNISPIFADPPSRKRGNTDIDQMLESDPGKDNFVSFSGFEPSEGIAQKNQERIAERSCDVDKISTESVA